MRPALANDVVIHVSATDTASATFKKVEQSAGGLGSALSKVGTIAAGFLAANVISGGVQKLTGFIGDSISAIKESIQVNAQLDAVLKSTGGAAGLTADHLKDLASSLEKSSMFEDEAILKGENLLLTFRNIKGTTFDRATQSLVDMAQALGTDAAGAAIQLGKALNDPIAGISALTRVGVSFTEEQKKQIKVMQEAGDIVGAQNIILAELNKEFGGSAKAASDAAGAAEIYKDKMNDLKEVIGAKLLPIQLAWKQAQAEMITFIANSVIPAVEGLGHVFTDTLIPAFKSAMDAIRTGFGTVINSPEFAGFKDAIENLHFDVKVDLFPTTSEALAQRSEDQKSWIATGAEFSKGFSEAVVAGVAAGAPAAAEAWWKGFGAVILGRSRGDGNVAGVDFASGFATGLDGERVAVTSSWSQTMDEMIGFATVATGEIAHAFAGAFVEVKAGLLDVEIGASSSFDAIAVAAETMETQIAVAFGEAAEDISSAIAQASSSAIASLQGIEAQAVATAGAVARAVSSGQAAQPATAAPVFALPQSFLDSQTFKDALNAAGGLPGFASGTSFVPRTGLALLHQGEAVIPASQNRGGSGGIVVNVQTMNINGDPRDPTGQAGDIGFGIAMAARLRGVMV